MKRQDGTKYVYIGALGENAYISFKRKGLNAAYVVASDNGSAPVNVGSDKDPKFKITIDGPSGNIHYFPMSFTFPIKSPADAKYQIIVSDEQDHIWEDIPTIDNGTKVYFCQFEFSAA